MQFLCSVFRMLAVSATEAFAEVQRDPESSAQAAAALARLMRGLPPRDHVVDLLPLLKQDSRAAALTCAASAHAEVWQARAQLVSARRGGRELWLSLPRDVFEAVGSAMPEDLSELLKSLC